MYKTFLFATLRVTGLASIVAAIKLSKISAGAEPLCKISGGGGEGAQGGL